MEILIQPDDVPMTVLAYEKESSYLTLKSEKDYIYMTDNYPVFLEICITKGNIRVVIEEVQT